MREVTDCESVQRNFKSWIIYALLLMAFMVANLLYYFNFSRLLGYGESDLGEMKGIILSDSLMYNGSSWIALKVEGMSLQTAFETLKSYPTLLPMTALTYTLGLLGINPIVFNSLLVFASTLLLKNTFQNLSGTDRFPWYALVAILFNTSTIYFSQSFTKEIMLLFTFCLFLHCLFRRQFIGIGFSICMLLILRVPYAAPAIGLGTWFILSDRLPRLRMRVLCLLAIALSAALPLYYSTTGLMTAAQIMLNNLGVTNGLTYHYIQSMNYPLLPLLFLPVRMVQSLFEPLFSLNALIKNLQVSQFLANGTALLHLVYFCVLLAKGRKLLGFDRKWFRSQIQMDKPLLCLIFLYLSSLIMFALLPFIQMRYLYPIAPALGLILDLAMASKPAVPKELENELNILAQG